MGETGETNLTTGLIIGQKGKENNMAIQFKKATKTQSKLRLAIAGPSGSGKTYTALIAATAIAQDGKIAVIDTERGSASLYSDQFAFDVLELDTYHPGLYIEAIQAAEASGYTVIVIDSLSHAWEGEGGALDLVDQATNRSASKNSYFAWKDVTPLQRKLIDAMLQSKCHVIATMRSKTDYIIDETERNGRKTQTPRKIGMAPVQRAGIEYEFTIFADMDVDHHMVVTKSRYAPWADLVAHKPTAALFAKLIEWLNSGDAPTDAAPSTPAAPPVHTPTQPAPAANGKISLETASAILSKSNNKPYGEIDSETLSYMSGELDKTLKKNRLTHEQKEEIKLKIDAIAVILQSRQPAGQAENFEPPF